jgi:hypothetical protein
MIRSCLAFFCVFVIASANAAPLTRDLGQGLAYLRVHELPADLPAAEAGRKPQSCVLDLRYVRGDEKAAAAVDAWLKSRATARTPVFVLANTDTAPALLAVLAPEDPVPAVIVIGAAARRFQPAIAVKISAENERRAYDALEKGVSLTLLLVENPDKVRNDEASLSKDRLAEAVADATDDDKARNPPPPIDAALQRAVHVHRALLALKKL